MKAFDYISNLKIDKLELSKGRYDYVVIFHGYAVDYFKIEEPIYDYMLKIIRLNAVNIKEEEYYKILEPNKFLRKLKLERILK